MIYVNKITGAKIDSPCFLSGENWEEVKEDNKKPIQPLKEKEKRKMANKPFATIEDVNKLFRVLTLDERNKAEELLHVVSDILRYEADRVGKDLDKMSKNNAVYNNVLKSVTVDVVARILLTPTDKEPMTQITESAMGYSFSGTYLNPGGGTMIKNVELQRLGLKRQRYGVIELWEDKQDL